MIQISKTKPRTILVQTSDNGLTQPLQQYYVSLESIMPSVFTMLHIAACDLPNTPVPW